MRTGKARSNIRHFLKTMQFEESIALGERLLEHALAAAGADHVQADEAAWERLLRESGIRSRQEVFADIGLGKRLPAVVARRLLRSAEREDTKGAARASGSVVIRGTEGMAVQLASCCRPIPGDAIVGSIKKGQGLVVHLPDCRAVERSRRNEPEQWIDVEWGDRSAPRTFQAALRVMVSNERGVLAKVASAIADAGSNIASITMEDEHSIHATMQFVVEVGDRRHLARVVRALRRLPEVGKLTRGRDG